MKSLCLFFLLILFSNLSLAQSTLAEFSGHWESHAINISLNGTNFSQCRSELPIEHTVNQFIMGDMIGIFCDGFHIYFESKPINIQEGGILSSATGVKGKITRSLVEIISPFYYQDGSMSESRTSMKLNSDNTMSLEYWIQDEYQKVYIEGQFFKN